MPADEHEIAEGPRDVYRGEEFVFAVRLNKWIVDTPTSVTFSAKYTERGDDTLFTSTLFPVGTAGTITGTVTYSPEIRFSDSALELGEYTVQLDIESDGYSPGKPYIRFNLLDI